MAFKAKNGTLQGWREQYYGKDGPGYGPNTLDALVSKSSATAQSAPSATAQPTYSQANPFKGSVDQVQSLPSGAHYLNPNDNRIYVKH